MKISPGERIILDPSRFQPFRDGVSTRVGSEICYCPTLGECWRYGDTKPGRRPITNAVDTCPAVPEHDAFTD